MELTFIHAAFLFLFLKVWELAIVYNFCLVFTNPDLTKVFTSLPELSLSTNVKCFNKLAV